MRAIILFQNFVLEVRPRLSFHYFVPEFVLEFRSRISFLDFVSEIRSRIRSRISFLVASQAGLARLPGRPGSSGSWAGQVGLGLGI